MILERYFCNISTFILKHEKPIHRATKKTKINLFSKLSFIKKKKIKVLLLIKIHKIDSKRNINTFTQVYLF